MKEAEGRRALLLGKDVRNERHARGRGAGLRGRDAHSRQEQPQVRPRQAAEKRECAPDGEQPGNQAHAIDAIDQQSKRDPRDDIGSGEDHPGHKSQL